MHKLKPEGEDGGQCCPYARDTTHASAWVRSAGCSPAAVGDFPAALYPAPGCRVDELFHHGYSVKMMSDVVGWGFNPVSYAPCSVVLPDESTRPVT